MSPSGYRIKKEFHQESKPHFFKCYQSQAMIKTSPLPFTPWPAPSRPCRRPRKHRLTSLEIGRQLGLLFACAQEETRKLSPKGEAGWTYPPVVICLYTPIFTWRKSWFSGSLLDMIFHWDLLVDIIHMGILCPTNLKGWYSGVQSLGRTRGL